MEYVCIYMTAASRQEAESIAEALLEENLAACANICGGLDSLYWWKGKIERSAETLCIFKTTRARFADAQKRILELHSYETPCIVALPILEGNPDYLRWIEESTRNR